MANLQIAKGTASGWSSAARVDGKLYFITDQGYLFLGTGTGTNDYKQIGVGIGANTDGSSVQSYWGLRAWANGQFLLKSGGTITGSLELDDTSSGSFQIDSNLTGYYLMFVDQSVDEIYIGYKTSGSTPAESSTILQGFVRLPYHAVIENSSNTDEYIASQNYVDNAIAALGNAISYVGESTTNPSTSGATVAGHTTWKKGEVVTYGTQEYINTLGGNTAAAWKLFGDEGSYALKTITIGTTGYLTGGGNLTANRTLDLTTAAKNAIDGAVQSLAFDTTSGTVDFLSGSKSGTTYTITAKYYNGGIIPLSIDAANGLTASLSASYVDGTVGTSATGKLLTKGTADGYYLNSASSGNTTALTVSTSSKAVTITPNTDSPSNNTGKLTTSAQVKSFVEGKGYITGIAWGSF